MSIDEELVELPEGWVFVKLEDITDFKNGINFQKDQKGENGILTIDVLNMYSQGIDINLDKLYRVNIEVNQERILKYGDILFVRSSVKREGVGWASLFKEIEEPVTFCGFIIRARILSQDINPKYLTYFLRTNSAREEIVKSSNQVTITNINQESLGKIQIPICPSIEQRRLVTKIEALKTRSQRVKDALLSIPALLEQFRQSVLAAAFSGALTADWREKNPDVEPAEVLLEKIRLERRRKWEEAELAKMTASGKAPLFDKWKDKYKEPEVIDDLELPKLPEGWSYARLDFISDVIDPNPRHRNPQYVDKGFSFITTAEFIEPDGINIDTNRRVAEETVVEQEQRCQFTETSIVFSRKGTIGKTRILPTDIRFALLDSLCVINPMPGINTNYLNFAFQSHVVNKQIELSTRGVALKQVSVGRVRSLIIPIPSLLEQIKLVEIIKGSFKKVWYVNEYLNDTFVTVESLSQSILAEAFRGALVPQDPNDEPASVLLERIRAEREKNTGATPKRSKKSADISPSQTNKNTGATSKRSNKGEPFKEAIQMELELE